MPYHFFSPHLGKGLAGFAPPDHATQQRSSMPAYFGQIVILAFGDEDIFNAHSGSPPFVLHVCGTAYKGRLRNNTAIASGGNRVTYWQVRTFTSL